MSFTESNTVEQMILDVIAHRQPSLLREVSPTYGTEAPGGAPRAESWDYVSGLLVPRLKGEVMVESWVREALIRLNPDDRRTT